MSSAHAPPDAIDRIAPTRRPGGRVVMYQRWAELLFLHWIVPPEMLRPLLPPGLTLDTYAGNAYIGLVPFTMTGVRPVFLPAFPPLSNFHETNVRTYVHFQGRDPGVWFFSLDAANAPAVRIARAWFKLPYHFARMRLGHPPEADAQQDSLASPSDALPTTECESDRLWPGPTPAACRVRYRPTGTPNPAPPGTLEHFLVERYILYAFSGGRLFSGRVHHPPYPLQTAEVETVQENLIAAAGITRPDTPPPLLHYAREVRVRIYPLRGIQA